MSEAASKYGPGENWKTGSSLRKARMEQFLEWMLTPDSARVPRTRTELATQMGINYSTLYRYEQDRAFQEQLIERRRGAFRVGDADKVIANLIAIATDPASKLAVAAARTLLEWAEKSAPQDTQGVVLEELSNEELVELANELYVRAEIDRIPDTAGNTVSISE